MLEIEIKARCADHDAVVKKIKSFGGILVKELHEHDVYFNHPSRNFKATDEALRVRVSDKKAILTYKGPKISNDTKTRPEQEVEFSDPVSMTGILKSLGFFPAGGTDKLRTIYKINNIEICIDKVKNLGDFVELEIKGEDRENDEKALFDLAGKLGLMEFERRSYLEMIMEKNKLL